MRVCARVEERERGRERERERDRGQSLSLHTLSLSMLCRSSSSPLLLSRAHSHTPSLPLLSLSFSCSLVLLISLRTDESLFFTSSLGRTLIFVEVSRSKKKAEYLFKKPCGPCQETSMTQGHRLQQKDTQGRHPHVILADFMLQRRRTQIVWRDAPRCMGL